MNLENSPYSSQKNNQQGNTMELSISRRMLLGLAAFCLLTLPGHVSGAQPAAARVVQRLQDFEDLKAGPVTAGGRIEPYYWPAELKAKAAEFSGAEVIAGAEFGKQCLSFTLAKDLPWLKQGAPTDRHQMPDLFRLPDVLPPDADALRLRVKVLEGQFTFAAGSPTIYLGNSDVLTRPATVTAGKDWQILEFSFTDGLSRNYRRAGFTRNAPVIHYTRWVQEPVRLWVFEKSQGRILFDQVELVSYGRGHPYPVFGPESVKPLAAIASFDKPEQLSRAFTLFLQGESDLPTGSTGLVRSSWSAARLRLVTEDGRPALEARNRFTEEVSLAGFKVSGAAPPDANAIRLVLKAEHPKLASVCLEFLALVAPGGQFPWTKLDLPTASGARPADAFSYYLCRNNAEGLSLGYYHARRLVERGKWTELVIPFADFACAYAQGDCAPLFKRQQPLSGADIAAFAWLSAFRQAGAETRILIAEVAYVRVPGEPAALRAFCQPPVP